MEKPDATDVAPTGKRKSQRLIFLPNSSPVPNWFLDTVLSDPAVPHAARSVFLYLLRKTVGWDNRFEELSLTEIQYGATVTRPTAIHAVRVICGCWGLFKKSRGRKGQHSSVFMIGGLTEAEFTERYELVSDIYGTGFPTAKQLREHPCTDELLRAQRATVEAERQREMQS